MKSILKIAVLAVLFQSFLSCDKKATAIEAQEEQRTKVEMVTDAGTMTIELYNETPLHRDNFIKLANNAAYDSLLFHRVIKNFMIQGGDPDSKKATPSDTLGSGDVSYTVDAEINKNFFHKKGALGAARDDNPERASSGMQFYIVHGKVYNDSLLTVDEKRINTWLAEHYFKKDIANKALLDSLQNAIDDKDFERYSMYNDSITSMASSYVNFEKYTIPNAHRDVYKSVGGSAHLDQNYTVFGEVVKGLNVIDAIAQVQTDSLDRPKIDVRILKVNVIEKTKKPE